LGELAETLSSLGVEIISTGGTEKELKQLGIKTVSLSSFTGFPEILDGRVKTLHPKIFGGILAKRENENHKKAVAEHGMKLIDLVIVNLYPFEKTISKPSVAVEEAVEQIDIGGPSLLRASAKNYPDVAVVTNPDRYKDIIQELKDKNGCLSLKTRQKLALEVFEHTSGYDSIIADYFQKEVVKSDDIFPANLIATYKKVNTLRYGENPHQKAAYYKGEKYKGPSVITSEILSGKELSFNNLIDLDSALAMIGDFNRPFAVILKHTNPCGAACADKLADAYADALACDPISAFGCIIGLNKIVDLETAKRIDETFFVECVIAPGYEKEALELLKKKKNRRFLACPQLLENKKIEPNQIKIIKGGALVQTLDNLETTAQDLKVVTQTSPTAEQIKSLLFAWKMAKHVKSNAILLACGEKTVGIGAGQMSRVDSSMIAVRKAGEKARGSVLASDAFFPMRDGVDAAAEAGVVAIIQPGGSKGDEEVIKAANEHKIAMVFTGVRHFKH
jgi:phosphoribosylaminoimidazolecarboxamide formyltransferase/IMP cyclohydrolase